MIEGLTPFQYAYFVESIEQSARWWSRISGAGPFFVTEHHTADTFSYRGQDLEADVSYAFGYAGEAQIQLIEQHDDTPSIYLDMFPNGTYGHHHIALLVPDYEYHRDRLIGEGFVLGCELHANDIDAAYLDTRSTIGCFTELHSHTERIVNTFARWRQAHQDWDGLGSALRTHVSGT
ncbi:MAG: VOC family protein [Acidimicrobiales bacterium]